MCVWLSLIRVANLKGQTHFTWGNFRILSLRFILIMLITTKYVGILVIFNGFSLFPIFNTALYKAFTRLTICSLTIFFLPLFIKLYFYFCCFFVVFFCLWIRLPVCWINVWAGRAINPHFWIKTQTAKAWASLCQQGTAVHTHTHTQSAECPASSQSKKGQSA